MEILELVDRLFTLKDNLKDKILNFEELIESLRELNELIELDAIKHLIKEQVEMIVYRLISGKILKPQFFHTLVCGPSGVGKTSVAKILAKIWSATGILKGGEIKREITITNFDEIKSKFDELYNNRFNGNRISSTLDEHWRYLKRYFDSFTFSSSTNDKSVCIAGRENFVGEYSGQTSVKTMDFLRSHIDRCIVVEEAYSLCHGSGDHYGAEVLTLLNRWMEEECDRNIFIFIGYKDMIYKNIFGNQPGLRRRFQCSFEIEGYSDKGLTDIFIQQLFKEDLYLDESIDIAEFFEKNKSYFRHYGGDTFRLVNYIKNRFYSDAFGKMFEKGKFRERDLSPSPISEEIFRKSFDDYVKYSLMD